MIFVIFFDPARTLGWWSDQIDDNNSSYMVFRVVTVVTPAITNIEATNFHPDHCLPIIHESPP